MENQKRNYAGGSFKSLGLVLLMGVVLFTGCASLNDPNMWRGVSNTYEDSLYREWDMKIKASQGVKATRVPDTYIIAPTPTHTNCPEYPYQPCQ